ncbi:hypothetical protein [Paenibacillus lignilyticus]|uniref:Uncharacterized protein n=1 Tax=Paenibacillus lignilyticus TaxID=1172615 RepID=A0ABS5CL30_9BACL|nr:hypothetical protein [Paenibacillus lignilyticus]MBP3966535.1 hypothetical protein [Paenibacillus lignilyticus]
MRKRSIKVGVCLIILILIGLYILVKSNPPLVSNGLTSNPNDNTYGIVEVQNVGFVDIVLKQVLVNESEEPKKVDLGVSRSNHLVLGGELDSDPNITFHAINELKIKPALSPAELKKLVANNDREVIRNYGIRIQHDNPIRQITVKYNYFMIPFTFRKDVSLQE